jgi:hypothetical protein
MNFPTNTPAQALAISPEALEVANKYLELQSISQCSQELGISTEVVAEYLGRREVKAYIDNVFMDMGFNNKFKMRSLMDMIISKKLQELDEAEVGSSKDIADLLALSHKMTMDVLEKEIQLEKVRSGKPAVQTNVQINEIGDGTKYGSLISKLLGS